MGLIWASPLDASTDVFPSNLENVCIIVNLCCPQCSCEITQRVSLKPSQRAKSRLWFGLLDIFDGEKLFHWDVMRQGESQILERRLSWMASLPKATLRTPCLAGAEYSENGDQEEAGIYQFLWRLHISLSIFRHQVERVNKSCWLVAGMTWRAIRVFLVDSLIWLVTTKVGTFLSTVVSLTW